MNIKRGDIYWIEQSKYRPAVGSVQAPGLPGIVVSNDANNAFSRTVEIVYLTGKPKKAIPTHCTIKSAEIPSVALCEQITTVSTEQLRDYVGRCTKAEMADIDRCITISLGIPTPEDQIADFTKKVALAGRVMPGKPDPDAKIRDLEMKLAATQARADLIQELYNNLLDRTTA